MIDTEELEKLIRDSVRSEMSAQQSRKQATNTYAQKLLETDTKVTEFIQNAINETTRAYRLSVNSYFISYVAAFILLLAGIILITFTEDDGYIVIPGIFIIGSIIWMVSLQNRNIGRNNRSLVNNLAKLNIIFAGYTRQIHQVDALFEEMVANSNQNTSELAEKLLNNLQDAMAEAMNAVTAISIETEE
jgi:hypothetical protein